MKTILPIVICMLLSCCYGNFESVRIKLEMEKLMSRIVTRTAASRPTLSICYITRGILDYLQSVRNSKFAADQYRELHKYINSTEPTLISSDPVLQRFQQESYIWVGDFAQGKCLPELTVSSKTPAQIQTEFNTFGILYTVCIPNAYNNNAESESIRNCALDQICLDEFTKPAWLSGESVENRYRYYIFLKYQLKCNNLDEYYDIQVVSQLEILLSDIKVLRNANPFSLSHRHPYLTKIHYGGLTGYRQFLRDDAIRFILSSPGICGLDSDSDLDRVLLELRCYLILALKYKSLSM